MLLFWKLSNLINYDLFKSIWKYSLFIIENNFNKDVKDSNPTFLIIKTHTHTHIYIYLFLQKLSFIYTYNSSLLETNSNLENSK